ncbi:hypothetical protein EDC04DRAFT_2892600 [Pisolithus marmoratus]|nr:hypothetical protein EDC04DRAFT_2892600 [Pisolithus marmoratus]
MRLGDFSAQVVIDGNQVEEYEVTHSGTQAMCWIASETGKTFSVEWICHATKHLGSEGELIVDGITCDTLIRDVDDMDSINFSVIHQGRKERDLMFCDLQLTDDEALMGKPVSSHLGEITLRVTCGTVFPYGESEDGDEDTSETNPKLTIDANIYHEKSVKKLTTHCVSFGPERKGGDYNLGTFIPNEDPPLEFVFKYRPIEILQANGVAPRPAPATPSAHSENPSGTHTQTKSGVLEQIAFLENELKRLRGQVLGETEEQKPKRIKRGHIEKHPAVCGEVIDLT